MAFEVITEAPRSQQMILAALLVAVVAGSGYYFVLSPKSAEVAQLRGQHTSLKAKLKQNRVLAANLSRFREEAAGLRRRLQTVKERLPNEKEMPQLFRQISSLAHRSGMVVSRFKPRVPEAQEFYDQVPILVNAATSYHQLGEFFAGLARLPRIVNIIDFKLLGVSAAALEQGGQVSFRRKEQKEKETSATQRLLGTMRAELTLMAYFLKADGTTQPTKPGAAKAPQRAK
ncbi:MAG: type 4a pilus biogenesis protein PilO [Candidatus Methylomirabilia bacterium]